MPSRRRCRRGFISVPVVPPRLPARLSQAYSPANRTGDPDTAPVEIAVVAELRAARRQQVKQPPHGGGRLAADADQRRAATAELSAAAAITTGFSQIRTGPAGSGSSWQRSCLRVSITGCPASRSSARILPRSVRESPDRPRQSTSEESSSR